MKKKSKTIEFQIPTPCHENPNQMTPNSLGRFCSKCEKSVINFTTMTDNEIIRYYQRNQGNICGMFRPDQVNRPMPIPRKPSSWERWKSIAAVLTGLLASDSASAFTSGFEGFPTEQNIHKNEKLSISQNPKTKIKGIVTDSIGNPLIGVTIIAGYSITGAVSDVNGNFEMTIPEDYLEIELSISYNGFDTEMIIVNKETYSTPLNITLKETVTPLVGAMVVGYTVPIQTQTTVCGSPVSIDQDEQLSSEPISNDEPTEVKNANESLVILKTFPNPFHSTLNLELDIPKSDTFLFNLYDSSGKLIFAKSYDLETGRQDIQLNIQDAQLPEGAYYLNMTDGKDLEISRQVFKGRP